MAWHPATIVRILGPVAILACGGGQKPAPPKEPVVTEVKKPPPPPPETEEDRERKRRAEATQIIPDGSSCLPAELRNAKGPRLELAAIGSEAVVCAIDQERTRLLGPIGCWTIEVAGPHPGALTYQAAAPLPGRGIAVMLDDRCARGYCLPKDAAVPADPVALMAWNLDGSKVAVLAGDTVHVFDASLKAHEASFSIRGDKGVASEPTAVHWNGDAIFVEASDGASSPVWVFRPDGTPLGPIEVLGGKEKVPLSTRTGSFVLLDKGRVGISEQGFSTLTIYEIDSGKRSKLVRKVPASSCKKDEAEALWRDPNANASARCKDFVAKNYAHLVGADAVAGTKNLLVLLRGPRLGELAVIDAKTLAERKTIKMPWCDTAGGGEKASSTSPEPSGGGPAPAAAPAPVAAPAPPPAPPARAAKKGGKKTDDPDSGGQ
jgi:hypothetical protein